MDSKCICNIIERIIELVNTNYRMCERVPQSVYLIEEMSELTKELTKEQRNKGNFMHIQEEIADVLGTLLTYSLSVGVNFQDVYDIMNQKIERGIQRLIRGEQ